MFEIFTRVNYADLTYRVVKNWERLDLPPVDKKKLKLKLLTYRKEGLHSLVNFLFFADEQPLLVVKMPRYMEGKLAFDAIRNEASILDKLEKYLPEHITSSHKLIVEDTVPMLLTRAYAGQMLHHLLDHEERRESLGSLLELGLGPLLKLSSSSANGRKTVDNEFIQENMINPFKSIAEYFPKIIPETEKSMDAFLKRGEFNGLSYPLVLLHQDYNPWNIMLTSDSRPIVFDWEDSMPAGLPLLDLYNYYLVSFRIMCYGETEKTRGRDPALKRERALALLDHFNAYLLKYCGLIDMDPRLADLFYVIFAINQCVLFLAEKRRQVSYAESWTPLLALAGDRNYFENHVRSETGA